MSFFTISTNLILLLLPGISIFSILCPIYSLSLLCTCPDYFSITSLTFRVAISKLYIMVPSPSSEPSLSLLLSFCHMSQPCPLLTTHSTMPASSSSPLLCSVLMMSPIFDVSKILHRIPALTQTSHLLALGLLNTLPPTLAGFPLAFPNKSK